jgi:hypothetical protein
MTPTFALSMFICFLAAIAVIEHHPVLAFVFVLLAIGVLE